MSAPLTTRRAAPPPLRRQSCAEAVGLEYADPLGDIAKIVAELPTRGMSPHRSVFVAYFVRFAAPPAAEAAAQAARADGWTTALYQSSTGFVVRLSRHGKARARDLAADRDYLRGFANDHGGRWEALALEQFPPDRYWESIAERYIARTAEPAELPAARDESVDRRRKSA